LLAVSEIYYKALGNTDQDTLNKFVEHYYEIRAGIGLNKSPEIYGAFPTDPYSHTPEDAGAQQPGMTGQVKEDIISRFYELGLIVEDGNLEFIPALLRNSEFLTEKKVFSYVSDSGKQSEIIINKGELAFTYCGIPIVYQRSKKNEAEVIFIDKKVHFDGLKLDTETSRSIFKREKKIKRINVFADPGLK